MKYTEQDVSELTEKVIAELETTIVNPEIHAFYKKIGTTHKELIQSLKVLAFYDVAKFSQERHSNVIIKLPKFNEVVQSGGLRAYIAATKIKQDKSEELIDLQIKDLKGTIRNRNRAIIVLIIGWIVTIVSENGEWGWSVFNSFHRKEMPIETHKSDFVETDSISLKDSLTIK
ncbi:MAG: hypothetical protein R2787_09190 [Saprospiraceae bacterium]